MALLSVFLSSAALLEYRNTSVVRHSISGVSSGGGIAANHLVAFSASIDGAGIVAGNPYGCGAPGVLSSTASCYYNRPPMNFQQLYAYTLQREKAGLIDATSNLAHIPIYAYSGESDSVVYQTEMKATATYFEHYSDSVLGIWNHNSQHGYITDNYGECCLCNQGTYIHNCNYDQAGAILKHIYGTLKARTFQIPTANFRRLSQKKYSPAGYSWAEVAMADEAIAYFPTGCSTPEKLAQCKIHLNYHGCGGAGDTVPHHVGFNVWAESNDIVIVYPQSDNSKNSGCWDWDASTGKYFDTKLGAQLQTVVAMVSDLENALLT